MSDEEKVRQALMELMGSNVGSAADQANVAAFDRILSDRDSLRAALKRIATMEYDDNGYEVARQALTSSEKENAEQ